MNWEKIEVENMKKSFLCKIGVHKWGRSTSISHAFQSNTLDWKKRCKRCGKIKRWVTAKNY